MWQKQFQEALIKIQSCYAREKTKRYLRERIKPHLCFVHIFTFKSFPSTLASFHFLLR